MNNRIVTFTRFAFASTVLTAGAVMFAPTSAMAQPPPLNCPTGMLEYGDVIEGVSGDWGSADMDFRFCANTSTGEVDVLTWQWDASINYLDGWYIVGMGVAPGVFHQEERDQWDYIDYALVGHLYLEVCHNSYGCVEVHGHVDFIWFVGFGLGHHWYWWVDFA